MERRESNVCLRRHLLVIYMVGVKFTLGHMDGKHGTTTVALQISPVTQNWLGLWGIDSVFTLAKAKQQGRRSREPEQGGSTVTRKSDKLLITIKTERFTYSSIRATGSSSSQATKTRANDTQITLLYLII